MTEKLTCILCPNGCDIQAQWDGKTVGKVSGASCPRGREYAVQELTEPKRNIATSVYVTGGELPLASVRLTAPIPKGMVMDAVREIQKIRLEAPVKAGTVLLQNILGCASDVIVTRGCEKSTGTSANLG